MLRNHNRYYSIQYVPIIVRKPCPVKCDGITAVANFVVRRKTLPNLPQKRYNVGFQKPRTEPTWRTALWISPCRGACRGLTGKTRAALRPAISWPTRKPAGRGGRPIGAGGSGSRRGILPRPRRRWKRADPPHPLPLSEGRGGESSLTSCASPEGRGEKEETRQDAIIGTRQDAASTGAFALRYNPLVLFGPSGTGKSHLVAVWRPCGRPHDRRRRVVCTTAVDFARELAEAIETQAVDEFRGKYRTAALLVFEDLGQLCHAEVGQAECHEELIHTLDAMVAEGGGW